MTYNINKVTDCICVWVENNSIEPRLISLTLSFGISKDLNIETPELLIGVVSNSNIDDWKKEEDFIEYIWNPAEYTYYEIESECINENFSFDEEMSRIYFIEILLRDKDKIISHIQEKIGFKPVIYVHDLDNHDIHSIISQNFNSIEIQNLKDIGLL